MPELPDITLYQVRLRERLVGQSVTNIGVWSMFVLRSVEVAPRDLIGDTVRDVFRVGKRLVFEFESGRTLIVHLMISGRFVWREGEKLARPKARDILWGIEFPNGVLSVAEASKKKRSSLHILPDRASAERLGRGGEDVRAMKTERFQTILQQENRTLKRALANPSWFDGIGNAFSDEILFHAKLSPMRLTQALKPEEIQRLHEAAKQTLEMWTERLQNEIKEFPKPSQVTAFRPDFATHGKFGKPCPVCGVPIQRIVYAENETNYCARCQNEDRILADRGLSRLLKDDWPRTVEQMLGEE
ncbi:MAG: hypothetical protein JNJ45_10100 [Chthonomonas sp.]|nr:hypothetical protein [Chthonomonas sp.]